MEKRRRKKTAVVIHAMMMQQYLQQIQTSVTKNNVSASVTVMNNGLSYIICWKKICSLIYCYRGLLVKLLNTLLKVILPDTYFEFFLLSNIFRHIKCNFVNYCDDKNFVFFTTVRLCYQSFCN